MCYLATFIPYVVTRNKAVQLHQKVFTPDWFRYEFAQLGSKVGIKMEAERKADYEKGATGRFDGDRFGQTSATTRRI